MRRETGSRNASHRIDGVRAAAYTIPTDKPESDGTFEWSSTTIVIVEVDAADVTGIGYTYSSPAVVIVVREHLEPVVKGIDATDIPLAWDRMVHAVRNIGGVGIGAAAISAVDNALWDLKAKILQLPLVELLGPVREAVPVYGSGGFTSYSTLELQEQLSGWVANGINSVKMKVGRDPEADRVRVSAARDAIGNEASLFVDANAAYDVKQAAVQARHFADSDVTWFEEPVSSDDHSGLRALRSEVPPAMEIAAGEYGYTPDYFRKMLDARCVDVLQADATRASGITGLLRVGELCDQAKIPLSAHTAPALHAHPACAISAMRNVEYFHDHIRIERMFFDGAQEPRKGLLIPDLNSYGLGLTLKRQDIERFRSL